MNKNIANAIIDDIGDCLTKHGMTDDTPIYYAECMNRMLAEQERAEYADKKRSSLNDYFTVANSVADKLDQQALAGGEE